MSVRLFHLVPFAALLIAACTTPQTTDAGDVAVIDAATDAVDHVQTPDVHDVTITPDVQDVAVTPDVQDVATDTGPSCNSTQTLCGTTCVDTQSDDANCGACGTVCPTGQTCMAGACACASGQMLCGTGSAAHCVDTQADNANCGACDTACPAAQTCTSGVCACPAGQTLCGTGSAAQCVNTQTDGANCGACGTTCSSVSTCTTGACACRATPEVLDQSQLAAFGGQGVPYPTVIGQAFRVGRTGALTAIEAELNGSCAATDGVILTLYRGTTAIGTARLGCSSLPGSSVALSATTRGPVVFDLSASCPSVTAGEMLDFRIAPDSPAPPAGICAGAGLRMCASGPRMNFPCFSDGECSSWSIGVGNTNGNPYPNGDMFYGSGYETNVDMAFKVFVR